MDDPENGAMCPVVLLTGATGFLGAWLARALLRRPNVQLLALVRAPDRTAGERRLSWAWCEWPALEAEIGQRIRVMPGDVREAGLGLAPADRQACVSQVTHILHSAADVRLHASLRALRRTNVQGTEQVLALARDMQRDHGLVRLSHVSTAYVAGRRPGEVAETDLSDAWGFDSPYEQSKFEAERLVRSAMDSLPISVFRPGMIVGDSRDGAIRRFNTFYYPLRLYLEGRTWVVPARSDLRVNIVPVDYVAEVIEGLTFDERALGGTFHVTLPQRHLPTAAELGAQTRSWARQTLGLRLHRPLFLSLPERLQRERMGLSRELAPLMVLLPYFRAGRSFCRDRLDCLLGTQAPDWQEFLPPMLGYAVAKGFLDLSERSVHEQVLYRLQSRHSPPDYRELCQGVDKRHTPAALLKEIRGIAGSLSHWGIGQGQVVAIWSDAGIRRFSLEVAIGLVGGIRLGFSGWDPPRRVAEALCDSGARVLFLDQRHAKFRLQGPASHVPRVSMHEGAADRDPTLTSWTELLGPALDAPWSGTTPAAPGDPSVLRYERGSDGRPRRLCYSHRQLRWLAETAATLPPWKDRLRQPTYLAWLPPGSVTESLVAAYAPYYLPGAARIRLVTSPKEVDLALGWARPSLVIGLGGLVRRILGRLERKPLGRLWLRLPDGRTRRLVGRTLGPWLLRSIGLERCRCLIVPPTPLAAHAEQHLGSLGVPIRRVYGLTQAPLLAMQPESCNGAEPGLRPAGETRVRIASDGEILIQGPQVASDCLANERAPTEAWLHTGEREVLSWCGKSAKDDDN